MFSQARSIDIWGWKLQSTHVDKSVTRCASWLFGFVFSCGLCKWNSECLLPQIVTISLRIVVGECMGRSQLIWRKMPIHLIFRIYLSNQQASDQLQRPKKQKKKATTKYTPAKRVSTSDPSNCLLDWRCLIAVIGFEPKWSHPGI